MTEQFMTEQFKAEQFKAEQFKADRSRTGQQTPGQPPTGSGADNETETVREFDVAGPVRLVLQAYSGDSTIETGPDGRVRVEAHSTVGRELLDQVQISLDGGVLRVSAPRTRRSWFTSSHDVDFRVLLPVGSGVDAQTASGELTLIGDLGELDLRTASGDIAVDAGRSLHIRAASGDLRVGNIAGDGRVSTASGDIEIGNLGGRAQVQSASGDVRLGEVTGDVEASTASGDIRIDGVGGQLRANSVSGGIEVGVVRGGRAQVNTSSGDLELGVPDGVAAWLDLTTASGEVRTDLEDSGEPGPDTPVVEIRAVSASGDIRIRRA
jgi:hypothetical protein